MGHPPTTHLARPPADAQLLVRLGPRRRHGPPSAREQRRRPPSRAPATTNREPHPQSLGKPRGAVAEISQSGGTSRFAHAWAPVRSGPSKRARGGSMGTRMTWPVTARLRREPRRPIVWGSFARAYAPWPRPRIYRTRVSDMPATPILSSPSSGPMCKGATMLRMDLGLGPPDLRASAPRIRPQVCVAPASTPPLPRCPLLPTCSPPILIPHAPSLGKEQRAVAADSLESLAMHTSWSNRETKNEKKKIMPTTHKSGYPTRHSVLCPWTVRGTRAARRRRGAPPPRLGLCRNETAGDGRDAAALASTLPTARPASTLRGAAWRSDAARFVRAPVQGREA